MKEIVYQFLIITLYTIFVQNLVMTSSLEISEALRVSARPGNFIKFAAMISGFSVLTGVACYFIDKNFIFSTPVSIKAMAYGLSLAAIYLVITLVSKFIFRCSKDILSIMGISALNTLVFAIPFVNNISAYSLTNTIASGLGAGVAFIISAALIYSASNRIRNDENIPKAFKGTPALFIYVGLISLAFVGFSDSSLF